MKNESSLSLEPETLTAFAATLMNLPSEEIRKAKKLYILNAIAEFQGQRGTGKAFLIMTGIMSIIPIFLLAFIPLLFAYRNGIRTMKQKLENATEVWKDDLGADYDAIMMRIAVL